MRPCFFEVASRIPDSISNCGLVGEKRHISHHHSPLGSSGNCCGMVKAFLHGDRKGVLITEYHIP
jgi:hypothetical protein